MTQPPSNALKDKWLEALLPEVVFDGWTDRSMLNAAKTAGLSQGEQALAAPGGLPDLIEHFFDRAQQQAQEKIGAADLDPMRVHQRVALGVRAWLDAMAADREAVRKAIQWGALPWRAGAPVERAWSVADMIWTTIGDSSEDYNKYTKRGLLAAALPGIIMGWLDETEDEAIDALIATRLKYAMQLGQTGGKLLGPLLKPFRRSARQAADA